MKIILRDIILPVNAESDEALSIASGKLKSIFNADCIISLSVYRKSFDARHKDRITAVYSVCADVAVENIKKETLTALKGSIAEDGNIEIEKGREKTDKSPVIVGFGPAGMFCGLLLAQNGYKPIILERGSDIPQRRKEVTLFEKNGVLNTESNIQFGAGGAGTFSDGKLVTRINDKKCRYVLEAFARFGAPESILTQAKPHVGTDNLGNIVTNIKNEIEHSGGKVLFNTKFLSYRNIKNGLDIKTTAGNIPCSSLVLATGHSARDTFITLNSLGLSMSPKPFSVGVRIEQLREEIDNGIYGKFSSVIGQAADYNFSHRVGEKCVYTFCMCPGGKVVAAASEENSVVVNGMSNYARDGENSNSALVVSVSPEDYGHELFDGMNFQRMLEKSAFSHGGENYSAPVQLAGDYLENKVSKKFGRVIPSYRGGEYTRFADLNKIFPQSVNSFLKKGLNLFENRVSGFAPYYAVLSGVETRTSSPVRMTRNDVSLLSAANDNIYPCGEGAGYAGGITSAAVDGIRVALEIMKRFAPFDN